ncbi:hypothetical protein EMPG_16214 [Blastomyces silverae]|uniref:Uncharacterized protein n=1 Tax=Blastomyces silverae TaxID=2060906 RepID=A0A0H1BA87_9EURO|nr:hypothetical protein EMPG_16214 [Blastomyces silverae]
MVPLENHLVKIIKHYLLIQKRLESVDTLSWALPAWHLQGTYEGRSKHVEVPAA